MPKCSGITLKGKRCQRSIKSGLYCRQHVKPDMDPDVKADMDPDVKSIHFIDPDIERLLNATGKSIPSFDILRLFQYDNGMVSADSNVVYGHNDLVPFEVDLKDECGETSLLIASRWSYHNIAKLLIELGADVNAHGQYGSTPLIWASINDSVETVKLILSRDDIIIDELDDLNYTPLIHAFENENFYIVKLLVENGADVDDKDDYENTALIAAVGCNRLDIVKFLLGHDAEIDCQNEYGDTALILAAHFGNEEIVKILLDFNADPNIQNSQGDTALIKAAKHSNLGIFKMLLDAKADPYINNRYEQNALVLIKSRLKLDFEDEETTINMVKTYFKIIKLLDNK